MHTHKVPVWLRLVSALLSLLAIVAALFFTLKSLINSEDFFAREYTKIGNAQAMGMHTDDLTAATMRMIDYMEGRVETIDMEVTVHGVRVNMFNERESAHMVDVRALYLGWRTAAWIFLALYIALILLLLVKKAPWQIVRAFLAAALLFVVLLLVLCAFAVADFDAFWTAFHHVFFSNDLWLLDPATSRMINMMPLQLFYDIVLQLVLRFALPFVAAATLCGVLLRRKKAREGGKS